jgi:hypothetical protein
MVASISEGVAMVVKFFLRHGAVIDWPVPDGAPFCFAALCTRVRGDGYFQTVDLYIPGDAIGTIALATDVAPLMN